MQLKAAGSKGVLVSGIQDKNAQLLVWLLTKYWQVKRSVLWC
jgi:hypothetical protein